MDSAHIKLSASRAIHPSPMNYIGGKAKLLPQILPHFPENITRFYDVFAGGANVAVNSNADQIVINDINCYVIEILQAFYQQNLDDLLANIQFYIDQYQLSKDNKQGFLTLRQDYNRQKQPMMLYTLMCYSFNYQFRFNNQHQYNNPFGTNRSQFSTILRQKLIHFVHQLKSKQVAFSQLPFCELLTQTQFTADDFIYLDPPYFITTGSYNDGNRGFKDWTQEQEQKLHDCLDSLTRQKIRFAMSNVLVHKGKTNDLLIEWAKNYHVIHLNHNYSHSCYNTVKGSSKEVLITNYL